MKKYLLLLILLFPITVNAFEFCELNDNSNFNSGHICKPSERKTTNYNKGSYEEKYSSVDKGYITSVKNQRSTGLCWSYANSSALETAAILDLGKTYDFSERHVEYKLFYDAYTNGDVNENGIDAELGGGGNDVFASSYYLMHYGPIAEEDMPFVNSEEKIDKSTMPTSSALLDVDTFITDTFNFGSCTTNTKDKMKEKIKKYGSVVVSIYINNDYSNIYNDKYFINTSQYETDHEVVVVGWDDTISKSNFPGATNDGAWIVKNSWGTGFGDSGYFYISYDDYTVCSYQVTYDDVELNDYDNVSSSSITTATSYIYETSGEMISAIPFTNDKTIYIDKVSVQVFSNTNYEVYLSTLDYQDESSWILLGKGTSSYDEVLSVNFEEIKITGNYTIIVKCSSNQLYIPVVVHSNALSEWNHVNFISSYYYDTNNEKWESYSNKTFTQNGYKFYDLTPIVYTYSRNDPININLELNDNILYQVGSNYIKYSLSVNRNDITPKLYIYDSNNNDVTSKFIIDSISIKIKDQIDLGTYYIKAVYSKYITTKEIKVESIFNNDNYKLEDTLFKFNLGSNNSLLISGLKIKIEYSIFNANKEEYTGEYLGTNSYLYINNIYYPVVVIGDVNGDGKINLGDIAKLYNHYKGITKLTGYYFEAGKIRNSNSISLGDISKLYNFYKGKISSL